MQRGATAFLKAVVVVIGAIVLALCIFWLPDLARKTAESNADYAYLKYPVLLGVYATAVPFYLALYHALRLLGCIEKKQPFSLPAIGGLRQIYYSGLTIVGFYLAGMLYLGWHGALHHGLALLGIAIILATMTITLFASLLRELFMKALDLNSEYELII